MNIHPYQSFITITNITSLLIKQANKVYIKKASQIKLFMPNKHIKPI